MKKMLFLMLFLVTLGTVGTNAQVRIGGNGRPNAAAVLDLNATDAINNGTKTLALPRVNLTSTSDQLGYTTLLNGMLVYSTNTTTGAGVYYWDTNKWVKVSGGEFVEGDGIIGNEITDTIANGGLTRSGSGTDTSPYKVGIKTGGIVNSMIADRAVSISKITASVADSGRYLFVDSTGAVVIMKAFEKLLINEASVSPRAPRAATFVNVVDTSVLITTRVGYFTRITAPGIRAGDICFNHGTETTLLFWTLYDMIIATSQRQVNDNRVHQIKCYRPTF